MQPKHKKKIQLTYLTRNFTLLSQEVVIPEIFVFLKYLYLPIKVFVKYFLEFATSGIQGSVKTIKMTLFPLLWFQHISLARKIIQAILEKKQKHIFLYLTLKFN